MSRYLRQLGTGHIYIATPALLKRRDMVPYDVKKALKRIKAIKEEIKKREQVIQGIGGENPGIEDIKTSVSKTLTELEKTLEEYKKKQAEVIGKEISESSLAPEDSTDGEKPITQEELARKEREKKISEDPHIKRIEGFRNKNQAEEYCLMEYGEEIDRRESLTKIKEKLKEMRIKRMIEAGVIDG